MKRKESATSQLDRREFPRLRASYQVRFGVCGAHGREVPGFTNDVSGSGLSFVSPTTKAQVGDHVTVEVTPPGSEAPLYFLGQVTRVDDAPGGKEIAIRFDWMGKCDQHRDRLEALLRGTADS